VSASQVRDETSWELRFAARVVETPSPTAAELLALRELQRRTEEAHR